MKRINPKTQKPFKRGDLRDDGYIFERYKTESPIKRDGTYIESWSRPQSPKEGVKRINEVTGQPFKRGDYDPKKDKYFCGWDSKGSDANGFRYEVWASLDSFQKQKQNALNLSRKYKEENKIKAANGLHKRRINPNTGLFFKRGDRDEQGRYFITYNRNARTNGYVGEEWGNYQTLLKRQISLSVKAAAERAKQKNLNFNITTAYMLDIYPKNEICPVFGTKMEWLGHSETSPSIDRIVPQLGYVVGNVAWISKKANTIKLDRSPQVLRKIADWIDIQIKKGENEKE